MSITTTSTTITIQYVKSKTKDELYDLITLILELKEKDAQRLAAFEGLLQTLKSDDITKDPLGTYR